MKFRPRSSSPTLAFGVPFLLSLCAPVVHAAQIDWATPVTGPFTDSTLWTGGVVPAAGDSATVAGGTVNIPSDWSVIDLIGGTSAGSTASLNQSAGSVQATGSLRLGTAASASGSYQLSGGKLTVANNLRVGEMGSGSLTIASDLDQLNTSTTARIIAGDRSVAPEDESAVASTTSTGLIRQTAGTVNTTAEIWVGLGSGGSGQTDPEGGYNADTFGTYELSGSAVLNPKNWFVLGRTGGEGRLTMSGGTINKTGNGSIVVGSHDGARTSTHGYLTQSGGTVNSVAALNIGNGADANVLMRAHGTYDLSGSAVLNVSNTLSIGRIGGVGVMNVSGGILTRDTAGNSYVGDGAISEGVLNQTGGIVNINSGEFRIANGVNAVNGERGAYSKGTYNLSGTGVLNVNSWLAIGREGGEGIFNMTGGTLNKAGGGGLTLGASGTPGAGGTMNQSGGTVNIVTGDTYLGENNGHATWTLSGTGIANLGPLYVGRSGPSAGTFNLDGGTLSTTLIGTAASSTSTFSFNGGLLKAAAADPANGYFFGFLTEVDVREGGAIIDTNGYDISIASSLLHGSTAATDGGLTKNGAGALTLLGSNTYNGPTNVNAGTLHLDFSDIDSSLVTVKKDAEMAFTDTCDINGTLNCNGRLTFEGDVVGHLTLTSSMNLAATTVASFRIAAPLATSDDISTRGPVKLNGATLSLTSLDGSALTPGSKFTLISTTNTLSGTFANAPTNGGTFTSGSSTFSIAYTAKAVSVTVISSSVATAYDTWASGMGLTSANNGRSADPDGDGLPNFAEFALASNPASPSASGQVVTRMAQIDGSRALTLTLPVRTGATFTGTTNLVSSNVEGVIYTIQAGTTPADLTTLSVTEVTPADTTGLLSLPDGWTYRTFRTPGTNTREFIRVKLDDTK